MFGKGLMNAEYDWTRSTRARGSGEFNCDGGGSYWVGLWDVVREDSGVVKAIGCISTMPVSGLVIYRIPMLLYVS